MELAETVITKEWVGSDDPDCCEWGGEVLRLLCRGARLLSPFTYRPPGKWLLNLENLVVYTKERSTGEIRVKNDASIR